MLCIVVICRCIASQLVKWRGGFGCRKGKGDGDEDGDGDGNGNGVSLSKCLQSDQKIGQAGCQGADPLKTRWLVFLGALNPASVALSA